LGPDPVERELGRRSAIAKANVPICKCSDRKTGIEIDMCFNNMLGVHNTAMLCTYAQIGPVCRPLVLCVKHWAKRRAVNDAGSGTLSSYAWVMLVIHFLQVRPDPGPRGARRHLHSFLTASAVWLASVTTPPCVNVTGRGALRDCVDCASVTHEPTTKPPA
jgi:DNA polymerase sigma